MYPSHLFFVAVSLIIVRIVIFVLVLSYLSVLMIAIVMCKIWKDTQDVRL